MVNCCEHSGQLCFKKDDKREDYTQVEVLCLVSNKS